MSVILTPTICCVYRNTSVSYHWTQRWITSCGSSNSRKRHYSSYFLTTWPRVRCPEPCWPRWRRAPRQTATAVPIRVDQPYQRPDRLTTFKYYDGVNWIATWLPSLLAAAGRVFTVTGQNGPPAKAASRQNSCEKRPRVCLAMSLFPLLTVRMDIARIQFVHLYEVQTYWVIGLCGGQKYS